jgi:hypothetical protein
MNALQSESRPSKVGMLDASFAHGADHEDHIASALFTLEVARSDGVARQLVMYRGYSIHEPPWHTSGPSPEPANLSPAQYAEKRRIMTVYSGQFPDTDIFNLWCQRFYPISSIAGGPGTLRNANGTCLEANGAGEGSPVSTATCRTAVASQTWTLFADGRVVGPENRCLSVASDESSLVLSTCTGAPGQKWTLMDNGQLLGAPARCLTAQGSTAWSTQCESDQSGERYYPISAQRWTLLSNP